MPIPKCRKCGSTHLTATSSQQYRTIDGQKRQVADVICDQCGHTWWSVNPIVRAMARKADRNRKERLLVEFKSAPGRVADRERKQSA